MQRMIENLRIGPYAMRYSQFVPRLYNYCRSLGFERERMMPSRAFCSDESQGYPVILIAQHFGTFPFDHGRVGGKVAINRHGPYAHHGEDLVIIQASHVGYDADSGRFGVYKRHRTDGCAFGDNCGKLCAVLHWYQEEYRHAREQVLCGALDGEEVVVIDNQYLDEKRPEGLFLNLDLMVVGEPVKVMSTAKVFRPSMALLGSLPGRRLAGQAAPDRRAADRRPVLLPSPGRGRHRRPRHSRSRAWAGDADAGHLEKSGAGCRAPYHPGRVRPHLSQHPARELLRRQEPAVHLRRQHRHLAARSVSVSADQIRALGRLCRTCATAAVSCSSSTTSPKRCARSRRKTRTGCRSTS